VVVVTDRHLASTRGPGGRLARFASGRTSTWLILGFWLVVFVLALSPAGKLTGAQENDAVS
jgi:putative drug exporter of the RND superfamily